VLLSGGAAFRRCCFPAVLLRFPTRAAPAGPTWRTDFARAEPAFGTGQVAEYGRLRLASIQPEK
jgi:hypothetical protein